MQKYDILQMQEILAIDKNAGRIFILRELRIFASCTK
jgi:hypothetical protein